MTCIVGVTGRGAVWLGADRRISDDDYIGTAPVPKIWRRSGVVLGACGSLAGLQHAQEARLPRYAGQDPRRYLIAHVAPVARQSQGSLEICAALGGRLWTVDSDGAVCAMPEAWAWGSGDQAARGALSVLTGRAESRVRRALEAAAEVCPVSVGPPFDLLRC